MGAEETSYCCVDCIAGCFGSGCGLECLEKRTNQPSRNKGNSRSAIRKSQSRSNNGYFAEGIQEEILTRLASIADLKVISRSSTQHYESKPRNLGEIAKQLGVAHILEGSVQKSGGVVRVNVKLIKGTTDSHL